MPTKPNYQLKAEREKHGWSQARVAEMIGTTSINVSRWERGSTSTSPFFREKLCNLFEKNALDLGLLPEAPSLLQDLDQNTSIDPFPLPEREGYQPVEVYQQSEQYQHREAYQQPQESIVPGARVLASLSYLLGWVTGLIVFLFNGERRFVAFHSLQSTFFFGSISIFYVLFYCIMFYVPFVLVHAIALIVAVLVTLIAVIAWITGIINASKGKYYKLPFVGYHIYRTIDALEKTKASPKASSPQMR